MVRENPLTPENINDEGRYLYMNGSEIFKSAVRLMQDAAEKVIADAGVKPEDISLFIPHQANIRIIDSLAKRLSIPEEKLFVNIQNYGNTSSASIPIAMVGSQTTGSSETRAILRSWYPSEADWFGAPFLVRF